MERAPQQKKARRPAQKNRPPQASQQARTLMASAPSQPLTTAVPRDTPRFADLANQGLVDQRLIDTITQDLKFDHMMPVQALTLHELLQNRIDCLAQAKTGTGKTIAFLLPAIQTMINQGRRGRTISMLCISPTRELAMQIAKEAMALLQRLPQYKVQFVIGGTNKNREADDLLRGCDILVATPGRLLDHLTDERIAYALRGLNTFVLDEADRLLDMGFYPSLKEIVQYLPKKADVPRQSMLFSATIAEHVEKVAGLVLSPGYKFISTIPKGEANTHERVPQFLIKVNTMSDAAPAMMAVLGAEARMAAGSTFKCIVFAPTAALADYYGMLIAQFKDLPTVSVLHSRVSQSKRTSITNQFRQAVNAICVATDVIARGMDFPGVTHIVQVGIPADRESYIHRLGRTARADKEGRGVFIISEPESFFLHALRDIRFQDYPETLHLPDLTEAVYKLDNPTKVYQAWLGSYKSHIRGMGWTPAELVRQANLFAFRSLGCSEVPGLQKKVVGKMGLKGVPGLNIVPNEEGSARHPRGGGEGRRM